MKCPFCGHEKTRVTRTQGIKRKRMCPECRWTFVTYERVKVTGEMAREIKESEE